MNIKEFIRAVRQEHDRRITERISSAAYILPTASATQKGGIKIGNGLSMDGDILSVNQESVMTRLATIENKLDALTSRVNKIDLDTESDDGDDSVDSDSVDSDSDDSDSDDSDAVDSDSDDSDAVDSDSDDSDSDDSDSVDSDSDDSDSVDSDSVDSDSDDSDSDGYDSDGYDSDGWATPDSWPVTNRDGYEPFYEYTPSVECEHTFIYEPYVSITQDSDDPWRFYVYLSGDYAPEDPDTHQEIVDLAEFYFDVGRNDSGQVILFETDAEKFRWDGNVLTVYLETVFWEGADFSDASEVTFTIDFS